MKKLLLIVTLFCSAASAQKYPLQTIEITETDSFGIGKKLTIPFVYHTTVTASGVEKSYVDNMGIILQNQIDAYRAAKAEKYHRHSIADIDNGASTTFVSTAVQNAVNNLQALIALKADKGTTGGGGAPYGNIISLPADVYINEIRPLDYGVTFNNGHQQGSWFTSGYEHATGLNYSSNAPDNVFQIAAYNMTPKGNRVLTTDGAWSSRIETNYDISKQMLNSFEPHVWNYINFAGESMRSLSGYFSKEIDPADNSSRGFWSMECDYLELSKPHKVGKNPVPYANFSEALISLRPTVEGRITGLQATNFYGTKLGIWDIGGETFCEIPGFLQGRGAHVKIPVKVYADDAAAKADNLVVGDTFWIIMNGRKVLTQVQ